MKKTGIIIFFFIICISCNKEEKNHKDDNKKTVSKGELVLSLSSSYTWERKHSLWSVAKPDSTYYDSDTSIQLFVIDSNHIRFLDYNFVKTDSQYTIDHNFLPVDTSIMIRFVDFSHLAPHGSALLSIYHKSKTIVVTKSSGGNGYGSSYSYTASY